MFFDYLLKYNYFVKKRMLGFIGCFLLFSAWYHIVSTVIAYGFLWWNSPQYFAIIRDLIWIVFVGILAIKNWKILKSFLRKRKKTIYYFCGLIIVSIWISWLQNKWVYDMFVGFKYWFYYIFIFLTASFIGYLLTNKKTKKENIKSFFDLVNWSLLAIVIIGFLWQLAKLLFPSFFLKIWYGPLNDFQFGVKPPIYYLTGFEGKLRRQWIFAGPNNYWYLLVAFSALIVSYFKFSINSIKEIFTKKQNLISLFVYILWFGAIILTLSRAAILGTIIVLILLNIQRRKRNWKIWAWIWIVGILGILALSILKDSSSLAHISAKLNGVTYVLEKPFGYWLGSSGPAIHHNWSILPENYFMQILIDSGLIGFVLLILCYISIWQQIKKSLNHKEINNYIKALLIWRIALLSIWMFLHVFEDSMVNYLFFVPLGLLVWYWNKKRA